MIAAGMAKGLAMRGTINSIISGVIVGIMAVVFATSYASMIFAGDLAVYLPNGIGIALACATIIAAAVALLSSYPSVVANPQDINSVVFGVAAAPNSKFNLDAFPLNVHGVFAVASG